MPAVNPLLGPLLGYWQAKRGGRALPARRDIDPIEIGAELLPNLILTDLLERGTRVRFRLVGTNVVKRLGYDPTGRYLEPLAKGSWFDLLGALHRLVYAERMPVYAESEFQWSAGRRFEVQQLLLPLAQDGPDPAIALVGVAFAADAAFAPTLRALADGASHVELSRRVLRAQTAREAVRASSRSVA